MGIETITGAASSSVSLGQGVAIAKTQVEGGTSRRFLPWVRQNLFFATPLSA
jgi:hypothetical protein